MALSDFLYRCPYCKAEPLAPSDSGANCPGCGRRFEPGSGRGTILVTERGGARSEVAAHVLAQRIADSGKGPETAAESGTVGVGGPIVLEARASLRRAWHEVPVRGDGGLLGFAERFGDPVRGMLGLTESKLSFVEESGERYEWPLRDLRALKGSSSEIQVSPASGGVVGFRLVEDSPRRWEDALKERLRAIWAREERGEVFEFQPRIRGR